MKKKNIGIVVLIIILLIIAFIGLSKYRNKLINDRKKSQESDQLTEKEIIEDINQTSMQIFQYYEEIPISKEDLNNSIYNLLSYIITDNRSMLSNNSVIEKEDYYEQNKNKINQLGIQTKDNFLTLATDIKNIYGNSDTQPTRVRVNVDKNDTTDENFYIFDLVVLNSNIKTLNIKCYVERQKNGKKSNNKNQIIYYKSNSELSQILENYKGVVSVTDFITTLENLTNNIQGIRNVTKRTNLNDQLQYYEQNKEKLQKMGIQSGEDFQSIVAQISNVDWSQGTQLDYYSIDLNTFSLKEDYAEFVLRYNYNTLDQINVKASLAQNGNVKPSIKFSGMDGERE